MGLLHSGPRVDLRVPSLDLVRSMQPVARSSAAMQIGCGSRRRWEPAVALVLVSVFPSPSSSQDNSGLSVSSWRGSVEASLGGLGEDDGEPFFEHPRGVDTDSRGRVYVADALANKLHVFDRQGDLVTSIGQKGQGPGDLASPCCIRIAAGGSVWVAENGNRRWSEFAWVSDRLEYVRSIPFPGQRSAYGMNAVLWMPTGRILHIGAVRNGPPPVSRLVRSVVSEQGRISAEDTVALPEVPEARSITLSHTDESGRTARRGVQQPFAPSPMFAFGPGGMWATARSDVFSIRVSNYSGSLVRTVVEDVVPMRVTPEERHDAEAELAGLSQDFRQRIPFDVPDVRPVLGSIGFDRDGRLWVFLDQPPDAEFNTAYVYTSESFRLCAVATWSQDVNLSSLMSIAGLTGWGTRIDADGVRTVVKVVFSESASGGGMI